MSSPGFTPPTQATAGQPVFHVGSVPVYGDLILAPMDGYSDLPFRSLCRSLGSAMSYTEFINALDVLHIRKRIEPKFAYLPHERPVVFQIFDEDPQRLLKAATLLLPYQPDIIDINMGCSAKSVSGRGAGAGLLREPAKVAQIFSLLSKNIPLPVTGKIRLGWDADSRNYLQIARIVEENGGALLAVHGRTRAQGYGGEADWDAIAEIKQALHIPVIGNGDVRSVADIQRLQAHTGCDGVMVGRAAIANPWIFARLERQNVTHTQVRQIVREHLSRMQAFYGVERGLVLFRKYVARTMAPLFASAEQRRQLLSETDAQVFLASIEALLDSD
jgi:tRNA-dihydrouridine synthase B